MANKPHWFMFLLIPMILLLAITRIGNTIDIQIHNTYIVINPIHFGLLLSVILGSFGGLYWLVRKKKLIYWMTIAHVLVTGIGLLSITGFSLKPDILNGTSGNSFYNYEQYQTIIMIISIAMLVWLLCQILFFINVAAGVMRNKEK
ncbi:hypothetical protein [Adhaeribacter arboris]|nr:hypothetical protein [Adhaeribacter arboris]